MLKKDDAVFLKHILTAISQVEQYLTGIDEASFSSNRLIQDGVIRQLEIIGEATRKLSPAMRRRYSAVPWQDIAGMRSKLIHDYFGVSIQAVWVTAQNDLPVLKEAVRRILETQATKDPWSEPGTGE